jgi:hypothetical protein
MYYVALDAQLKDKKVNRFVDSGDVYAGKKPKRKPAVVKQQRVAAEKARGTGGDGAPQLPPGMEPSKEGKGPGNGSKASAAKPAGNYASLERVSSLCIALY